MFFLFVFQLPPPQLENALNRTAALKAPLVAHASQHNIRNSLPRFDMKDELLSLVNLWFFYFYHAPVFLKNTHLNLSC